MGARRVQRLAATLVCAAIALSMGGCGGDSASLPTRTIYLAVPLSGPLKARGADMADAAKMALDGINYDTAKTRLKLKVVDSSGAEARDQAGADVSAVALIGGLSVAGVKSLSPAPGKSELLQVGLAPAPTELGVASARTRNVIWQLPFAPGQGDALAQYIAALTQNEIGFIGDGTSFSRSVNSGFLTGIGRTGIRLIILPGSTDSPVVGAGSAKGFVQADDPANSTPPSPHTLITSGMTAESYPPAGEQFFKAFSEDFGRQPDRFAIYAYESIGLVVDAIERVEAAGGAVDQAAVTDQAFKIKNRFGPVGHYDVMPSGRTTLYTFQARGGDAPVGPASLIEAQR